MRVADTVCAMERFELIPTQQGALKRCIWGFHLVVEFWNSPFDEIAEAEKVKSALIFALTNNNSEDGNIRAVSYQFKPFGVSAQVNDGKSHIYIHTWPENGYSAIDILAEDQGRAYEILSRLQMALKPEKVCVAEVPRGITNSDWGET